MGIFHTLSAWKESDINYEGCKVFRGFFFGYRRAGQILTMRDVKYHDNLQRSREQIVRY